MVWGTKTAQHYMVDHGSVLTCYTCYRDGTKAANEPQRWLGVFGKCPGVTVRPQGSHYTWGLALLSCPLFVKNTRRLCFKYFLPSSIKQMIFPKHRGGLIYPNKASERSLAATFLSDLGVMKVLDLPAYLPGSAGTKDRIGNSTHLCLQGLYTLKVQKDPQRAISIPPGHSRST